MELTRETARSQAKVQPVQLAEDLVGYVRRLPGTALADIVEAVQCEPAERASRLTALCACDASGVPLFEDLSESTLAEIAEWPQLWLLKMADAAGQVNGLHLEPDSDPKPEPGAS